MHHGKRSKQAPGYDRYTNYSMSFQKKNNRGQVHYVSKGDTKVRENGEVKTKKPKRNNTMTAKGTGKVSCQTDNKFEKAGFRWKIAGETY